MTMCLNVDVRQFRAILKFLPETASRPRSNTLSCKWAKVTVKRAIVVKISFQSAKFKPFKFCKISRSVILWFCKITRSLRYVDAVSILFTRDAVRFQTWISAKSLNTARYNTLTFHLNSKAFERNWESWYKHWEDRFVCIRKNRSSFFWEFMDQVRTYRSEPKGSDL